MRIIITSDVHFHFSWYDIFKHFVKRLTELEADLLILAGDIGEPLDVFSEALDLFADVAPQRVALAGNHDVWNRDMSYPSRELWEKKLPSTAVAKGYHWLEDENLSIDGLGIAGSLAWYDYSGKADEIKMSDDDYMRLKSLISNDGKYVDWPWLDVQIAEMLSDGLIERLDLLEQDDAINDVLLVTHVPIFADMQRSMGDPEKRIADAYYLNLTLGKRVLPYQKLRMVMSGHVHIGHEKEIERDGLPPLTAYTNPSDYGRPAALLLDTETWEVETLPFEKPPE